MSDKPMEIVIVRHGQTTANRDGIIQGHMNSQLDDLGMAQAQTVAKRLQHEHFDAAFYSDLDRASNTAQAILQYHPGLPAQATAELREWNLGVLQEQSYKNMSPEHKKLVDILRSSEDVPPIPGGETIEEFQQRVSDFLEDLAGKYTGKRILLISHGGVIQRMLRHTVGKLQNGNFRPACDNTSVSIFRKRLDGGWQMISWNDTSHLKNGMYSGKPLPL